MPAGTSALLGSVPTLDGFSECANVDRSIVDASVRVRRGNSSGSGTIFHLDVKREFALVLTCKHLFSSRDVPGQTREGDIVVTLPNGKERERSARLIALDAKADLALLAIWADSETPYVPLSDSEPEDGETLWQVGYPGGSGPIQREGPSRGYRSWTNGVPNLDATIADSRGRGSIPGDSGSGVFRRNDKKLVAVLWGGPGGGPGCRAHGLTSIRVFLELDCCRHWFPILPWRRAHQRPREEAPPPRTVPADPKRPMPPLSPPEARLPDTNPGYGNGGDRPVSKAELDDLRSKLLEAIARIPSGPPGPKGDTGPIGPAGPQGLPGAAAVVTDSQLKSIEEQVIAALSKRRVSLRCELIDKDGKTIQVEEFGEGIPLRIKLLPVQAK